jgi:DNA-binding transcriptional MerR regulator/mannose-6-phosphate isomerase-like protein (cupin superfamily)
MAAPAPPRARRDRRATVATTSLLGYVGIEEAARAVGVSPSTIRLWERQDLIAPVRTRGGVRRFDAAALARLRTIRHWRTIHGLNAPAIHRVLNDGQTRPLRPNGSGALGPEGSTGRRGIRPSRPAAAPIAPRLRTMRVTAGLTLRDAAARSDLSTSFISALERGLTGASIAVLRRLVAAYGSTLGDLLGSRDQANGRLVPAAGRRVLDTGTGVRIEDLANAPLALESHLFILAPGASSQGGYSHQGEEFMYLLSGSLGLWLDASDEYYELSAGDALTFPSTLAHRFRALGSTETRLIWINTPPTF